MDPREFPTKGNLMLAKNSLALAHQGYDLMDKKRNILLKELMSLIDEAKDIQEEIDQTFTKAYACLRVRISSMESAKCGNWHLPCRSKILSASRRGVLWEQRSRMSNTMQSRMI